MQLVAAFSKVLCYTQAIGWVLSPGQPRWREPGTKVCL